MNALGKYCHDFPRLAKESGYKFHLYRGRINWSELDKVNIQQITSCRDFQLLEQNLIHVINCNLDAEYDVKILDENFVKLFKLAQLGIDYLSYCILYLDRCVILLQEQLSSFQQKCSGLKEENERKDDKLRRNKTMKTCKQNFKCKKCEKLFLNESYLQSHEKRRHNHLQDEVDKNKNVQIVFNDREQQTEEVKKSISVATQTLSESNPLAVNGSVACSDTTKIKEQEMKIDNLQRDLEELKSRLSLTEKSMENSNNTKDRNNRSYCACSPSAVIPIIHSYLTQPGFGTSPNSDPVPRTAPNHFFIERNESRRMDSEIPEGLPSAEAVVPSVMVSPKIPAAEPISKTVCQFESFDEGANLKENVEESVKAEENVEMQTIKNGESIPSPRAIIQNMKNHKPFVELLQENMKEDDLTISPIHSIGDLKLEFSSSSEKLYSSTPVMESNKVNQCGNAVLKSYDLNNTNSKSENFTETKSKSIMRRMVPGKTSKIQELTVNLKNSISHLYDTVYSATKKSNELQEPNLNFNSKENVENGLSLKLKELGIDPEWSGIPKETMKQKLCILEHRRNLLSKENRLYPFIRKNLQKKILQKIKKRATASNDGQRLTAEAVATMTRDDEVGNEDDSEIKVYPPKRDSDAEEMKSALLRQSEAPTSGIAEQEFQEKSLLANTKETDFSIFQASKFRGCNPAKSLENLDRQKFPNTIDEIQTDSDFDDEFCSVFHQQSIQSIERHVKEIPERDAIASFPDSLQIRDEYTTFKNGKAKSGRIPESEVELSQQPSSGGKKKVLFAEKPEVFHSSASNTIKDGKTTPLDKSKLADMFSGFDNDEDDDWSVENEWKV